MDRGRILILGPLAAIGPDGRERLVVRRKERLVFAGLLVAAGRVVPAEGLVGTAWPHEPPASARRSVHAYVSRLRRALAEADVDAVIASTPAGYRLAIAPGATDADSVAVRMARADCAHRQGDLDQARALLSAAQAEWRGQPFGDLCDEPFLRPEVRRLDELRASLEDRLVDVALARGDTGAAIGSLFDLTAAAPLREARWARLVAALATANRRTEALQAFEQARLHLRAALGVEPGAELRDLAESIRATGAGVATIQQRL